MKGILKNKQLDVVQEQLTDEQNIQKAVLKAEKIGNLRTRQDKGTSYYTLRNEQNQILNVYSAKHGKSNDETEVLSEQFKIIYQIMVDSNKIENLTKAGTEQKFFLFDEGVNMVHSIIIDPKKTLDANLAKNGMDMYASGAKGKAWQPLKHKFSDNSKSEIAINDSKTKVRKIEDSYEQYKDISVEQISDPSNTSSKSNIKKQDISINNLEESESIVEVKKQNSLNVVQEQPTISYWRNGWEEKVETIKKYAKLTSKVALTGGVGMGSALAMMPVFNYNVKQLEEFDVDIHDKESFFIVSTLNTLLALSICNSTGMWKYLSHKTAIDNEPTLRMGNQSTDTNVLEQFILMLGKFASAVVTTQSLALLWDIELNNKEVVRDNNPFDEFTAWATFTTLPLVAYKLIENYGNYTNSIHSFANRNFEMDSVGAKTFVYGTALASLAGRGIALTKVYDTIFKQMGMNDDAALGTAIAFGGVMSNLAQASMEYGHVQDLFEKSIKPNSFANKVGALIATIEGAWFALPIVAQGLNAVEGLNSILKMIIFLPTLLSRMIFEMHNIYDTFQSAEEVGSIHSKSSKHQIHLDREEVEQINNYLAETLLNKNDQVEGQNVMGEESSLHMSYVD